MRRHPSAAPMRAAQPSRTSTGAVAGRELPEEPLDGVMSCSFIGQSRGVREGAAITSHAPNGTSTLRARGSSGNGASRSLREHRTVVYRPGPAPRPGRIGDIGYSVAVK